MEDLYSILNIEKNASAEEIKKAYRKLAFQFHPDRNPGDKQAEEKFKKITEAYSVLGDETKRRQYDRHESDSFSEPFSRASEFYQRDPFDDFFENRNYRYTYTYSRNYSKPDGNFNYAEFLLSVFQVLLCMAGFFTLPFFFFRILFFVGFVEGLKTATANLKYLWNKILASGEKNGK
ncbi:DnaJ domain-containing protein [Treponema sp.]|uniref:DnaJ domain-containing protein n=1 Tax=Treponema sp. TaxID=166 RepID=UPI003F0BD5F6